VSHFETHYSFQNYLNEVIKTVIISRRARGDSKRHHRVSKILNQDFN
jgi:hypothetical protein